MNRCTASNSYIGPTRLLLLVSMALLGRATQAADDRGFHFRCDPGSMVTQPVRIVGVAESSASPGHLLAPSRLRNSGSWRFDGRRAIAYTVPSNTDGFEENFTWSGFFRSPSSNSVLPETGIADRLVTQFAFDRGNWTRLAIGLAADPTGAARLCIELEGFEGRTFGMGDQVVQSDRWHHFALVHEGTTAAASIRWYLDYKLTGELLLGGQSNQNTLRPAGSAPITLGARLDTGDGVDRGFQGLIDEVRLLPYVLGVDDFVRSEGIRAVMARDTGHPVQQQDSFWEHRHRWAREMVSGWTSAQTRVSSIDAGVNQAQRPIDDAAFLRRLSLTVRGRITTLDEVTAFLADGRPDKRLRMIDRFLASPQWADGWVGYWQDVLAENPSVVFPTLNNSGAFRQWIYESLRGNKPFDRFATELILMKNTSPAAETAGPSGFALATGNDAPSAMRALVAMRAFAAVDLKCARCHDSPDGEFLQSELFLLAAYLNGGPLEVPHTSLAASGKAEQTDIITSSLTAEQVIEPAGLTSFWLSEPENANSLRPFQRGNPRAELAALITSPRNSRFSDVIVNRLWQRFFGEGLMEPVDQWYQGPAAEQPESLLFLSSEFVNSGYDLQALARRILSSDAWQSQRVRRQRLSAEQLVDSLFVAVGKDFEAETLGVHATDPGAVQLPRPHRAWQFAALPNERDRPALGMPVNQTIVDVMRTFGWNGSRQQPRSVRDPATSALQPLMIFNGLMSQRIVRLSEYSGITELCLQDVSLAQLIDQLFLTVLGRRPDDDERRKVTALLDTSFPHRRTGQPPRPVVPLSTFQPDWRKHLEPDQTRLMLAAQQRVAQGEPPTARLTTEFRECVEDVLWALINSPEFMVIP